MAISNISPIDACQKQLSWCNVRLTFGQCIARRETARYAVMNYRGHYEQANPYCNTTDGSGDYEQRAVYGAGPEFPIRESDPEHRSAGLEHPPCRNRAGT